MRYLLFLLLCFFLACQTTKDQTKNNTTKAPVTIKEYTMDDIPVYDYEGFKHLLKKNNDTTYVVNFWATWCRPCVAELPYFESLHHDYADKPVEVVLVSLDFKKQLESKLIPFLNKNKTSSKVVVLSDPDSNSWIDKVDVSWSGAIPATLVYRKGHRAFYEQSFESQEELMDIVAPFLK